MKTFLALGDSYTIGEQVLLTETFAYETVQQLRALDIATAAPEIIAKTGWTTDELLTAMDNHIFLLQYNFVTVLIGVNNQYRGRDVPNFEIEFEGILKKAVAFAGNNAENVFVLSIPDWGVTPFAIEKNTVRIASDIDSYNAAVEKYANQYECVFIDITTSQRADANDKTMLAGDGLHPSGKEYAKWATQIVLAIKKAMTE
jgi:lysophospholipase L1-like esterase